MTDVCVCVPTQLLFSLSFLSVKKVTTRVMCIRPLVVLNVNVPVASSAPYQFHLPPVTAHMLIRTHTCVNARRLGNSLGRYRVGAGPARAFLLSLASRVRLYIRAAGAAAAAALSGRFRPMTARIRTA